METMRGRSLEFPLVSTKVHRKATESVPRWDWETASTTALHFGWGMGCPNSKLASRGGCHCTKEKAPNGLVLRHGSSKGN